MNILKNVLSSEDIKKLLDFYHSDDNLKETNENVSSKHPIWNVTDWPQYIIEKTVDSLVEEVFYLETWRGIFQVHVDSGYGKLKPSIQYLFPLVSDGGSTVFFDNYWEGNASKFVKGKNIYDGGGSTYKRDDRVADYSKIKNYNDQPFDKVIYEKYLSHLPYENMHGLTVNNIVEWNPGDCIVWNRRQLHSSSNTHKHKIGLSVFCYEVDN